MDEQLVKATPKRAFSHKKGQERCLPSSYLHRERQQEVLECMLLVIKASIHHFLFLRKVYPQRWFKSERLFLTHIKACRHPTVREYISEAIATMKEPLSSGQVQTVCLCVEIAGCAPHELLCIHPSVLVHTDASVVPWEEVDGALRGFLLQMHNLNCAMPSAVEGATFHVSLQARTPSDIPRPNWALYEDPRQLAIAAADASNLEDPQAAPRASHSGSSHELGRGASPTSKDEIPATHPDESVDFGGSNQSSSLLPRSQSQQQNNRPGKACLPMSASQSPPAKQVVGLEAPCSQMHKVCERGHKRNRSDLHACTQNESIQNLSRCNPTYTQPSLHVWDQNKKKAVPQDPAPCLLAQHRGLRAHTCSRDESVAFGGKAGSSRVNAVQLQSSHNSGVLDLLRSLDACEDAEQVICDGTDSENILDACQKASDPVRVSACMPAAQVKDHVRQKPAVTMSTAHDPGGGIYSENRNRNVGDTQWHQHSEAMEHASGVQSTQNRVHEEQFDEGPNFFKFGACKQTMIGVHRPDHVATGDTSPLVPTDDARRPHVTVSQRIPTNNVNMQQVRDTEVGFSGGLLRAGPSTPLGAGMNEWPEFFGALMASYDGFAQRPVQPQVQSQDGTISVHVSTGGNEGAAASDTQDLHAQERAWQGQVTHAPSRQVAPPEAAINMVLRPLIDTHIPEVLWLRANVLYLEEAQRVV